MGENGAKAMMIIVSGLPGSGKTYFASRLAERIQARYISSDLMRKDIDARGQYAFEDKLTVYDQMARKAGDFLRNGETVVIDATFYRHEMRNLFGTLARLLYKKICYIEIFADEDLIRQRLERPRLHSEADFSVYESVRSQYESFDAEHLSLKSSDDNLEELLTRAEAYIRTVNEGA